MTYAIQYRNQLFLEHPLIDFRSSPSNGSRRWDRRTSEIHTAWTRNRHRRGWTPIPLSAEHLPDTSLAAKDRPLGGLGILLVRKMADDILYQRRIDKNVLTLIIHVDQSDDAP